MKKVILLAAVAVMAVFSANAQGKWYIGTTGVGQSFLTGGANGGGIGLVGDYPFMTGFMTTKDYTKYGIAPEIGYNINNAFSVGLGIGVSGETYNPATGSGAIKSAMAFGINPYVRWFAWRKDNFAFYAQGDIQYAAGSQKYEGTSDKGKSHAFSIGVLPGIAYTFNNHFSMTASFGVLGYSQYANNNTVDGKMKSQKGVFGLSIDNGLDFGLTYTF